MLVAAMRNLLAVFVAVLAVPVSRTSGKPSARTTRLMRVSPLGDFASLNNTHDRVVLYSLAADIGQILWNNSHTKLPPSETMSYKGGKFIGSVIRDVAVDVLNMPDPLECARLIVRNMNCLAKRAMLANIIRIADEDIGVFHAHPPRVVSDLVHYLDGAVAEQCSLSPREFLSGLETSAGPETSAGQETNAVLVANADLNLNLKIVADAYAILVYLLSGDDKGRMALRERFIAIIEVGYYNMSVEINATALKVMRFAEMVMARVLVSKIDKYDFDGALLVHLTKQTDKRAVLMLNMIKANKFTLNNMLNYLIGRHHGYNNIWFVVNFFAHHKKTQLNGDDWERGQYRKYFSANTMSLKRMLALNDNLPVIISIPPRALFDLMLYGLSLRVFKSTMLVLVAQARALLLPEGVAAIKELVRNIDNPEDEALWALAQKENHVQNRRVWEDDQPAETMDSEQPAGSDSSEDIDVKF
ncbi:hypothetical protein PAPHI01_2211 [Pancytospora philotis]|nr:hypothetical protein PAPHI01_2211 [Pancytospora philotis]